MSTTDIEAARQAWQEMQAVEAMAQVWQIETGGLTEQATPELLEAAKAAAAALPDDSEHKENLAVMADAAAAELSKPKLTYYGVCTITFYCAGACCCGQWASGNTASGTRATPNRTVAHGSLPFGTRLLIDGQEYVVEDRGVNGAWVDIFVPTHAEADARGMYQTEVWIVE